MTGLRLRAGIATGPNDEQRIIFHCPGCHEAHWIDLLRWTWNEDLALPTFSPSLLVRWYGFPKAAGDGVADDTLAIQARLDGPGEQICHSFVKDGQIQFLDDCTHHLKGQTVDIPPWPYRKDS